MDVNTIMMMMMNYSFVSLAGVCDNKLLFIDCYAGEVGSIHDSALLRKSDLFSKMETVPSMFVNNSHLLGDLAYPLKQHLIVGFKNNGHLTRQQNKFNQTLSGARSCIERSFALLKGRWRRLKYLNMSTVEFIPAVILACCILHNICILNDDMFDVPSFDEDENNAMHVNAPGNDASRIEGARKREAIMSSL